MGKKSNTAWMQLKTDLISVGGSQFNSLSVKALVLRSCWSYKGCLRDALPEVWKEAEKVNIVVPTAFQALIEGI